MMSLKSFVVKLNVVHLSIIVFQDGLLWHSDLPTVYAIFAVGKGVRFLLGIGRDHWEEKAVIKRKSHGRATRKQRQSKKQKTKLGTKCEIKLKVQKQKKSF